MEHNLQSHAFLDSMYLTLGRPVINLRPEGTKMMEAYLQLLIKMYEFFPEKIRQEMASNLYADIHKGISILYRNKTDEVHSLSKSELICRNFTQLVMQHYSQTRNVAWYAEKLNITHAHLCTTVKQITGKLVSTSSRLWLSWMQITIEIFTAFHPEHFRLPELCQCFLFREIF